MNSKNKTKKEEAKSKRGYDLKIVGGHLQMNKDQILEIINEENGHYRSSLVKDHEGLRRSLEFTKFQYELTDIVMRAEKFERGRGFGSNYPAHPMIDSEFRMTKKEKAAIDTFKDKKPFKLDGEKWLDAAQELLVDLSDAHNHIPPVITHSGDWEIGSGTSFYTPNMIFLTGPKSVIVLLHEYGHSLGFKEVAAVWWSNNMFRLAFPKAFKKLRPSKAYPHLLRKYKEPESHPDFDEVMKHIRWDEIENPDE